MPPSADFFQEFLSSQFPSVDGDGRGEHWSTWVPGRLAYYIEALQDKVEDVGKVLKGMELSFGVDPEVGLCSAGWCRLCLMLSWSRWRPLP